MGNERMQQPKIVVTTTMQDNHVVECRCSHRRRDVKMQEKLICCRGRNTQHKELKKKSHEKSNQKLNETRQR